MGFKALLVDKAEDGKTHAEVKTIEAEDLPEGNVLVSVHYSTLNYKDGLCLGPGGGLVRTYPHVPGIDFSGVVEESQDPRYKPGDEVILTGWRVGEVHWGGYAQKARVNADWLVPLPKGLTLRQAMAVGTPGFTAMISILSLENHGLKPGDGPVLVTGAAGGVGSLSVTLLASAGYEVAAGTGRPETEDYLKSLGATEIVLRDTLSEPTKAPLERETWAGCIDAAGGPAVGRIAKQLKRGAGIAAVGLAGGADVPLSLVPFLLRGVNLLGIDSVMQPYENRVAAWDRIVSGLDLAKLEETVQPATLSDLPGLGRDILKGNVRGRVVVDLET
ncbi:MAG: MDR family oxidoreductase [Pseudomonadota bacterium]